MIAYVIHKIRQVDTLFLPCTGCLAEHVHAFNMISGSDFDVRGENLLW